MSQPVVAEVHMVLRNPEGGGTKGTEGYYVFGYQTNGAAQAALRTLQKFVGDKVSDSALELRSGELIFPENIAAVSVVRRKRTRPTYFSVIQMDDEDRASSGRKNSITTS